MQLCITLHYRKVAEECLDMAERTADPAKRENSQRIAEVWLHSRLMSSWEPVENQDD
jgi:hypothetical protein